MKKLLATLLLMVAVCFGACNQYDDDAYIVENTFEPYVAAFKTYAKQYGHNFDDTPLVIQFAHLTDGKAGQCYMNSSPLLIEIDQTYWDLLDQSSNKHNLRQELIFHEMGHGLLQRYHLNDQLNRSDWKSIMFGDELPNKCQPTINYRGMRQAYYIKELFTQTTEVPQWSTLPEPDFSQVQETPIVTFSTNPATCPFPIVNNQTFSSTFQNNELVYTNNNSYNVAIPLNISCPTQNNFYYEITFKLTSHNNSALDAGPIWGEGTNTHLHYFSVGTNQHASVGEISCLFPFLDFYHSGITSHYNTIAVRKHNNYAYYYINGTFVYYNDLADLRHGGDLMGISISGNSTIHITNVVIKAPNTPTNRTANEPTIQPMPKMQTPWAK